MLIPLYDGDLIRYQVGFAAESYWKKIHEELGEEVDIENSPPPFSIAQEILDNRIANTNAIVETTIPPIFYFTGKGNFRNEISTTGYKIRTGHKPFHWKNIDAYLKSMYECVTVDGLEADDLLSLRQVEEGENTIIIGADKDLLQVPGWHYIFEYGNVAAFGPHKVEGYGKIWLDDKGKLRGYGSKFFLSQCLTGDRVDSIIGIPKCGPVKALKTLVNTETYQEGLKAVREAYKAFYGDLGDTKLLENGQLLWMTRKLNEDGTPVLWSLETEP